MIAIKAVCGGLQIITVIVKNVILTVISAFCLAVCLGETPTGKAYLKAIADSRIEKKQNLVHPSLTLHH